MAGPGRKRTPRATSAAEGEPIGAQAADTAPVVIPEAGAVAQNDEFTATVDARGIVSIKPNGWVGPAPLQVHGSKVPALRALLDELVSAPEAPESAD